MTLNCEICDRRFPTNNSLYIHKQTQHGQPKLLIMQHEHGENDAEGKDPQLDEELEIFDEFTRKKRKNYSDDDSDNDTRKRRVNIDVRDNIKVDDISSDDDENNKRLEVVDEYDINNDDDDDDDEHAGKLKIIDSSNGLRMKKIKEPSNEKMSHYQKMYERCKMSHKEQKFKHQKMVDSLKK